MELVISKKDLVNFLGKVTGVLQAKPAVPALSHLMLEAGGETVTARGTDLEVTVSVTTGAEIKKAGKTLVPGKKLLDVVREFPEAPLTLASEKDNQLQVSQGRTRLRLMGLNAEDYPEIPKIKEPRTISLSAQVLKNCLAHTRSVVVADENKPNLSGVFFTTEDGWLTAVSTDTRRLARYRTRTNLAGETSFILPLKAADMIRNLWEDNEDLQVEQGRNQVIFTGRNTTLTSQLIEGTFPDYGRVIPEEETLKNIALPRAAFISALRRISQVLAVEKKLVQIEMKAGLLVVTGEASGIGDGREEIEIAYQGEGFTLCFNPEYILDGLRCLDEEDDFLFGFNPNAEKPNLVRNIKSREFLYLVMPLRA